MDTFRLVLLYCFGFAFFAVCADVWLIVHGFEQIASFVWDFLKVAIAGEIIMFSLYKIALEAGVRVPKWFRRKHEQVDEMEENNERETN